MNKKWRCCCSPCSLVTCRRSLWNAAKKLRNETVKNIALTGKMHHTTAGGVSNPNKLRVDILSVQDFSPINNHLSELDDKTLSLQFMQISSLALISSKQRSQLHPSNLEWRKIIFWTQLFNFVGRLGSFGRMRPYYSPPCIGGLSCDRIFQCSQPWIHGLRNSSFIILLYIDRATQFHEGIFI